MKPEPAVTGVAGHNGWAVFVTVAAEAGKLTVIDRRRVELIDAGLPNQPYEHETFSLDAARAEQLVAEVRESAVRCAERAIGRLRSMLMGHGIRAIVTRDAPLAHLPLSVAEAHASYPVTNRADAMLYHVSLCDAAKVLGIAVETIKRGQERQKAAEALGIGAETLDRWLDGLRTSLGPPWQKDQKEAAARASSVLGRSGKIGI